MNYYVMFLVNICILITITYLCNLGFKYLLINVSARTKGVILVGLFIAGGWITMKFGIRWDGHNLFDLRTVPIIFGTLLFRKPRYLIIIGLGIALSRYTINGITSQSITGSINILLLGILAAFLVSLYERKNYSYAKKAIISILSINTLQIVGILSFGSIPKHKYLIDILPFTYPAGIFLSGLFVFFVGDFYKEQLRADKLRQLNTILRKQTKELRQSKRELQIYANQMMQASKYKSEFIANMSHELKTPLNSILLLSELMFEDDETKEDNKNFSKLIYASGSDLLHIINDILDLSTIEAGKMDVICDSFVLDDLIQNLFLIHSPQALKKGLVLQIIIANDVPAIVTSDAKKIQHILGNLLSNAIKFTNTGSISLHINLYGTDSIVFNVIDTGIGLEVDKQHDIFEAFQQGNGAINREYGGAGLGLAISLKLAILLGGKLTVQSKNGIGSEFSFVLPVEVAKQIEGNNVSVLA